MARLDLSKPGAWVVLLVVVLVVVAAALFNQCTASPEKEREFFTQKMDKLDILALKLPLQRLSIAAKMQEFKVDFEKAAPDLEHMRAVNQRIDSYIVELEKSVLPPPATGPAHPSPALPAPVPVPPANSSGFGGQ